MNDETPTNDPKARALDAVADMIRAALDSGAPTRFADAERLCQIGHTLCRVAPQRAGDAEVMRGGVVHLPGNPPWGADDVGEVPGMPMHAFDPGAQWQRDILLAARPILAGLAEQLANGAAESKARVASYQAEELRNLEETLQVMKNPERREFIERRIRRLHETIESSRELLKSAADVAERFPATLDDGEAPMAGCDGACPACGDDAELNPHPET